MKSASARSRSCAAGREHDTGERPRRAFPLGSGYLLALTRYAELGENAPKAGATIGDLITKYEVEALPKLKPNTIRVQRSDIKRLRD
jgi:hypothetical protein